MTQALSGTGRCTVVVKAAPNVGELHGEVVCCAGVDADRKWVRLYPVSFPKLKEDQRFNRWSVIEYDWRKPVGDNRIESRRVEHSSLKIIANVKAHAGRRLVNPMLVTSTTKEYEAGKSFALLKAEILDFLTVARPRADVEAEKEAFRIARSQGDMFSDADPRPHEPSPYEFKYRYRSDDGVRTGTCQDWEISHTFLKWRKLYGETDTLNRMRQRFGTDLPAKGIALAMGTHRHWKHQWLINGIIQIDIDAPAELGL